MWEHSIEVLNDGRVHKLRVRRSGEPVAYRDVLSLWQNDTPFRTFFISLLADAPFPAYRWETPAITETTAGREFEFVLLRYDALERTVDRAAFSDYFNNKGVVTFDNLGRDAVLVVPCPVGNLAAYGHLASFTNGAPEAQQHELWQAAGSAMQKRLSRKPVWLSTAGMGVSWLHVRLDDRPKYYGYQSYKAIP